MLAVCQICGEVFAEISLEGRLDSGIAIAPLRYPMNGTMFGSADPFHGVLPPYALSAAVEWEHMRHYGIHRPTINPDEVLTTKGLVKLPKDGAPAYLMNAQPPEMDREKIADAVVMVSDEDAERQVRERIKTAEGQIRTELSEKIQEHDAALIVEYKEPIPPLYIYGVTIDPDKSAFICAKCNKSFTTMAALRGHMGGAHKTKSGKKG